MKPPILLALDQGTTSTRAIAFDAKGRALATAARPLKQSYPADGWVEHDAEEIFAVGLAASAVSTAISGCSSTASTTSDDSSGRLATAT